MKNLLRILIGIIFSILAIYIISKNIDFKQLVNELKLFNPFILGVLVFFYPATIYLRSLRWKLLIQQKIKIPLKTSIVAMMVGFFANYLLPAKMGELVRAEIIKQKMKTGRSFILTTVLAERILDSIILLIFLLFSALFSKTIQALINNYFTTILVFVLVFGGIVLLITNRKILSIFLNLIPRFNKKVESMLNNVLLAVSFYKNRILFLKIFILSAVIWLILTLFYYIIAYGLEIDLPYYGYFFLISMAAFGMILPASPGNIGVYHGIVMAAILIFLPGENEKALSFAIISHAFDLIPTVLFGFIATQYFGLSFKINQKKQ